MGDSGWLQAARRDARRGGATGAVRGDRSRRSEAADPVWGIWRPWARSAHECSDGRVSRRPSRRGAIVAGTDAAHAALVPAADILEERIELAFDHLRIVGDAVERVRVELEVSGIATAFVGTMFTMAELRAVYEAIWGIQLDAANFRRSLVGEDGWVIPTGRTARSGRGGGRPAELYRAGRAWKAGVPLHRIQPTDKRGRDR